VAGLAVADGIVLMIARAVAHKTGFGDPLSLLRVITVTGCTGRVRVLLMTGRTLQLIAVGSTFIINIGDDIFMTG